MSDTCALSFSHSGSPLGMRITAAGNIARCTGAEAIRQSILMLLATIPGERIMRPDYGCHLHRLAFLPNDDTTAGMAIHYVRSAVEHFEPRVDVEQVDAYADPVATELLHIVLDYRIRQSGLAERLDYAYHLAGGDS